MSVVRPFGPVSSLGNPRGPTLIENGHSILVIEHNPDVIKSADWLIDLGKEGGKKGGELIFEGLPEDIINCKESSTGYFLKEKFN